MLEAHTKSMEVHAGFLVCMVLACLIFFGGNQCVACFYGMILIFYNPARLFAVERSMGKKYVGYFRVSTQKQGVSGLGLESQRSIVEAYVAREGGELVGWHVDVESGRKRDRAGLSAALEEVSRAGAVLVIAKMDRLGRNAAFLMQLMDSKVDFVACDLVGANRLTLVLMAEVAQMEAEMISDRTRAALAAKKARGFVLGNSGNFTQAGREAGAGAMRSRAEGNLNNRRASGYAKELRKGGMTLEGIAGRLNAEGYRTSRGGLFAAIQVSRVLSMYS
jgi:DNA invertase Pin-like site-specific DNA recombinase